MNELGSWLTDSFPGIYVKSIEIGNGKDDSFLMPMNSQVAQFCAKVKADPHFNNGFNILGFSQGSLIVRGAVERCSFPNVYNLITISGAHAGIFGIPYLEDLPAHFRELISKYAYTDIAQGMLSISGYWRDPYNLDTYHKKSQFLADINNEDLTPNELYRQNLLKLNAFVMTYSDLDEIITPRQSGWFMGYQTDTLKVELWNSSKVFQDDLIGMKTLLNTDRLHVYTSHTKHRESTHAPNKEFFFKNILQYFNNTL
ncbi:unnamed protein product [Didymodactylos carnosus]|nr:unnamed protein product [Didymodactylos carnosus]CAF3597192.1 unnamed protein product [Didymodactylos carnosus]